MMMMMMVKMMMMMMMMMMEMMIIMWMKIMCFDCTNRPGCVLTMRPCVVNETPQQSPLVLSWYI